jgi:hypothetical protein
MFGGGVDHTSAELLDHDAFSVLGDAGLSQSSLDGSSRYLATRSRRRCQGQRDPLARRSDRPRATGPGSGRRRNVQRSLVRRDQDESSVRAT